MKIMFKYLDREIDIDLTEFQDGKEPVTIIPHDVLHDLIYNSEEAAQNNIQVHSVLSFSEPGHYAYQCVINDKNGRRIEGFGESTAATLTTEIARNYPALMANKRAFDDAAIKFLGCEGKVYSDQQIDISGQQLSSAASCDDYSADAENDESGDISGDISDDISSADDAQEPAPKTAAKQNSAAKSTGKKAPEPAADEDDPDLDEFDTTIIVCGSLKREGLSVRAAYEKKPDAIEWIAKNLPGKNDTFKAQKEICQRFLEHVQNGGC